MRDKYIQIKVTEKEKEEIIREAKKRRLPVSTFLRLLVWERIENAKGSVNNDRA